MAKKDELPQAEISVELTEEEKLQIEQEVREEVAKALRTSKRKAFKEAARQRIQSEALFRSGKDMTGEDLIEVGLNLASHPKYIMLNGTVYHHGRKYKVTRGVAQVLLEQMYRGWDQDEARMDPSERSNFKQHREFRLGADGRAKQVA